MPFFRTYWKASAIAALAFLFFERLALADDLVSALSGRTAFEAGKAYRPWRQYFAPDGKTVYFGDGPSSLGLWEVRGGQYCSLWPPVKEWECYEMEFMPEKQPFTSIVWIAKDGSRIAADLFDGDQTQFRSSPKP